MGPAHTPGRQFTGSLDWLSQRRRGRCLQFLTGSVEIETCDGSVRRLGPGDILLAEDTTGQGHISRAVAGEPRRCLFVPVENG